MDGVGRWEWTGLTLGNFWHFSNWPFTSSPSYCLVWGMGWCCRAEISQIHGGKERRLVAWLDFTQCSGALIFCFKVKAFGVEAGQSQVMSETAALSAIVLVLGLAYLLKRWIEFTTWRFEADQGQGIYRAEKIVGARLDRSCKKKPSWGKLLCSLRRQLNHECLFGFKGTLPLKWDRSLTAILPATKQFLDFFFSYEWSLEGVRKSR